MYRGVGVKKRKRKNKVRFRAYWTLIPCKGKDAYSEKFPRVVRI